MPFLSQDLFATYSIVARDPETGHLGVAVQTHQMCVGATVPWLEPGVGAVATQAMTNRRFGPMALSLLREGVPAPKVVEALVASDDDADVRQLAVVDTEGRVGAWTGAKTIAFASHALGAGYSVQANMMLSTGVPEAMAVAYERTQGDLAVRLLAALVAAQAAGGDIRGTQSAALKVVESTGSIGQRALYDLRIDEHPAPLTELSRLVRLRSAQFIDMRGHERLEAGHRQEAIDLWSKARTLAPELEELAFWQAIALADGHQAVAQAVEVLRPVLEADPLQSQWIDLVARLRDCGFIQRPGAVEELMEALGSETAAN